MPTHTLTLVILMTYFLHYGRMIKEPFYQFRKGMFVGNISWKVDVRKNFLG